MMSDLRKAAEQALDFLLTRSLGAGSVIDELRAALAEPEQSEPVAWMDSSGHPKHIRHIQSAAERHLYGKLQPLFAAPPRREPLSDEQIDSIQQAWIARGMNGSRSFARAIEAAHGITGGKE